MTVGELKRRMTVSELLSWQSYAAQMGPLNLPWRIDYAVARAAVRYFGGKLGEFMPYPVEEEREASIEDVMAVLKGAKVKPGEEPPASASVGK